MLNIEELFEHLRKERVIYAPFVNQVDLDKGVISITHSEKMLCKTKQPLYPKVEIFTGKDKFIISDKDIIPKLLSSSNKKFEEIKQEVKSFKILQYEPQHGYYITMLSDNLPWFDVNIMFQKQRALCAHLFPIAVYRLKKSKADKLLDEIRKEKTNKRKGRRR